MFRGSSEKLQELVHLHSTVDSMGPTYQQTLPKPKTTKNRVIKPMTLAYSDKRCEVRKEMTYYGTFRFVHVFLGSLR